MYRDKATGEDKMKGTHSTMKMSEQWRKRHRKRFGIQEDQFEHASELNEDAESASD
jgi:hypothetical protein